MSMLSKRGQATVMIIFVIVAVIALVGMLISLGVVNTGKAWQSQPTTPPCPEGWIKAWASSTNHTDMLKAGYDCTQSVIKGMVCCSH